MAQDRSTRPTVVLVNRCFVLNAGRQIALVKRRPTDTNNAGLWEGPGGKLEKGQGLTEALTSEVLQETGLVVRVIHPMAYWIERMITDGDYAGLPYLALFHIAEPIGPTTIHLSEEHTEGGWYLYRQMMRDLPITAEMREAGTVLYDHLK